MSCHSFSDRRFDVGGSIIWSSVWMVNSIYINGHRPRCWKLDYMEVCVLSTSVPPISETTDSKIQTIWKFEADVTLTVTSVQRHSYESKYQINTVSNVGGREIFRNTNKKNTSAAYRQCTGLHKRENTDDFAIFTLSYDTYFTTRVVYRRKFIRLTK